MSHDKLAGGMPACNVLTYLSKYKTYYDKSQKRLIYDTAGTC